MSDRHLSDDQLIDLCVTATAGGADASAHLAACPVCETRRLSIVDILAELDAAADVNADAAFPPEKLERQQARILQRVDQDGRPGRVISVPAYQAPDTLLRSRPRVRWEIGKSVV